MTRIPPRDRSASFTIAHQRIERDRRNIEPLRIVRRLILRPTERRRETLRERIGPALPPVVAQAEDDEPVPGDELVLGGKDRIGRRMPGSPLRGPRAESARRPSHRTSAAR